MQRKATRLNLIARGFPECALPRIPYDKTRRDAALQKLRLRDRLRRSHSSTNADQNILVFKCEYTPQYKYIGLRKEYANLIRKLRAYVGNDFLRDVRFVVAHPVATNAFMLTYRYNFVPQKCYATQSGVW